MACVLSLSIGRHVLRLCGVRCIDKTNEAVGNAKGNVMVPESVTSKCADAANEPNESECPQGK
jgi:hypothetical protein